MNRGLVESQRRAFFAAVRNAARELEEDPDAYRRRIMGEELEVEHLADVSRGEGFDRLMARALSDAGDYEAASRYALGTLSRLRYLVIKAAARICDLKGGGVALDYVAGVMRQCGMVKLARGAHIESVSERIATLDAWQDFTPEQVRGLLMMLNTHLKRLVRKT